MTDSHARDSRADGARRPPEPELPDGTKPPSPEVTVKPRRRFTAAYKLRILREADRCDRGKLGALVRREGLYSSLLSHWRRQRERGELKALSPRKRGPKPVKNPLADENQRLRLENERLQRRLQEAETIIEVQKKLSALLASPLNHAASNGSDS